MVQAATVAPNATWHAVLRWLAVHSKAAQRENPLLKSVEMTRNLRLETGAKARAALKFR